jgi:hypothetical protein
MVRAAADATAESPSRLADGRTVTQAEAMAHNAREKTIWETGFMLMALFQQSIDTAGTGINMMYMLFHADIRGAITFYSTAF